MESVGALCPRDGDGRRYIQLGRLAGSDRRTGQTVNLLAHTNRTSAHTIGARRIERQCAARLSSNLLRRRRGESRSRKYCLRRVSIRWCIPAPERRFRTQLCILDFLAIRFAVDDFFLARSFPVALVPCSSRCPSRTPSKEGGVYQLRAAPGTALEANSH